MPTKSMEDQEAEQIGIETPAAAAGAPAVIEVARQILAKPGVARGIKGLRKMNQPGGFDCPGCAWPEADKPKTIEFCENGAKAFADEATTKLVTEEFFAGHSLAGMAQQTGQWLNEQGRLCQPMVKKPGTDNYEPITWFSAFELISKHLNDLESPDQAAFYTSGRTSNEAAFLWQLFVRAYGTNNLPDCSNLCHESSGVGLTEVIGSGKGTVRLSDFDHAEAIFVFGQNPGSNHPRMLATLEKAKQRGARIVSINPLNEVGSRKFKNPQTLKGWVGEGTQLTDLHLPVRINGDVALIKGLCRAILEAETKSRGKIIDRKFIAQHTQGFNEFVADINTTSWKEIELASGIEASVIREAAAIAIEAKSTICCWAMGLTQHKNAVANVQEIINFLMLLGNLGRKGAGACPVRGHSNVQGDRTMGIWEKPDKAFLDRLGARFKFTPPESPGHDTVSTIRAMAEGRVKVLLALGGNFMAASPDSGYTAKAIESCELTVQISTKLNQSHVVTGKTALILPVLGRSEIDNQPEGKQFVTAENSMGVVSMSRGVLPPASQSLKSEVRLVAEIAESVVGARTDIKWSDFAADYNLIRDEIGLVIPGFDDFNDRLIEEGSIELPHSVRDQLKFDNAHGKGLFTVHDTVPPEVPEGCYLMMTIRSHDQFNTTVYSQNDRYRGIENDRQVVFMHPQDMTTAGLAANSKVKITSHFNGETRSMNGFRVVPYDIPSGCVATYYPETNPLIPVKHVADGSNTPAYKSVLVSLAQDS